MAHLKHLQAGLHNINVGQVGHRDICRLYSLKKDLMMVNLDICRLYLFKERIMMTVTFIWQKNNFDSMQWWSIWISASSVHLLKIILIQWWSGLDICGFHSFKIGRVIWMSRDFLSFKERKGCGWCFCQNSMLLSTLADNILSVLVSPANIY